MTFVISCLKIADGENKAKARFVLIDMHGIQNILVPTAVLRWSLALRTVRSSDCERKLEMEEYTHSVLNIINT